MKASSVKLKDLTTWNECDEAIEAIQFDPNNIVGGLSAYYSGYQTHVTKEAERKIAAIRRKMAKFPVEEDDCE